MIGKGASRPIVFLDRDGVLNRLVKDPRTGLFESPYAPTDVDVPSSAVEAVRLLRSVDASLIIVSNQPAAAKGTCTLDDLEAVHNAIVSVFAGHGLAFDAVEYCHHHPDAVVDALVGPCACRKPEPGLLVAGAARVGSGRPSSTWVIGDSDVDILAGHAFGALTILVEEPLSAHRRSGAVAPDYRAGSVLSAAEIVVQELCHCSRSSGEI